MMKIYLTATLFVTTCLIIVTHTYPVQDESEVDAALYLQKFGYLEESNDSIAGAMLSHDTVSSALKEFQRFAGLKETGELDKATVELMNSPRCGVKDKIGHSDSTRKKRYAHQGSTWQKTSLTYRITKYPARLNDRGRVDREVARAFKMWSDVTSLSFREIRSGQADIEIRFEAREHGDGSPFDGRGKTLAHAFFPQYGGNAHFDDEESWSFAGDGTNLFQVAAHEFGHSLGLSHTDETAAVMAPMYREYNSNYKLHSDDIQGIQTLYGSNGWRIFRRRVYYHITIQGMQDAPNLCEDAKIDTITRTQNGSTYVFKGDFYWKILNSGIADGYPKNLTSDWDGLEGNLDASLTWSNGKTYIFKGKRYWRFTNKKMDNGYPKLIKRGFEGIPNNLDAAFVWSGNGKTYFVKGNQYWRYDSNKNPPVSDKYPRPIRYWKGLPSDGLDAAFQYENGQTYFFKGNNYYKFDDEKFEVASVHPPYPRSTAVWWFHCKQNDTEEILNNEDYRDNEDYKDNEIYDEIYNKDNNIYNVDYDTDKEIYNEIHDRDNEMQDETYNEI